MKKLLSIIFLSATTLIVLAGIMSDDGKAGYTGSPGEFDCTACHTGHAVNSGTGSIVISSPNMTNWQYVPGQTYQIDVTVSQTGSPLFGFDFEALRTSNNTNGGTFGITSSSTTQLKNSNGTGSNRSNVVHKKDGGRSNDTHTFSFNWNAPASNVGNIIFYATGNASDDQGDTLGDYIYKIQQLITPSVTGISEINHSSLGIHPNPSTGKLNFALKESVNSIGYRLYDVSGKNVANGNLLKPSDENFSITLSSDLKNGLYWLEVNADDHFYAQKFLLSR